MLSILSFALSCFGSAVELSFRQEDYSAKQKRNREHLKFLKMQLRIVKLYFLGKFSRKIALKKTLLQIFP